MQCAAEFTKICQVVGTLIHTRQFNDHCTPTPTRSTACNSSETQDLLIVVKKKIIPSDWQAWMISCLMHFFCKSYGLRRTLRYFCV